MCLPYMFFTLMACYYFLGGEKVSEVGSGFSVPNVDTLPVKIVKVDSSALNLSVGVIPFSFKNNSNKKIKALRFMFDGYDVFGDGAFDGIRRKGASLEIELNPHQTKVYDFDIGNKSVRKIKNAEVYEIIFADGAKMRR